MRTRMKNKDVKRAPDAAGDARFGYPRPQLQREGWISLNGDWEFAIDATGHITRESEISFDSTIVVPFAPETPASNIGHTGYIAACWYRRTFDTPTLSDGQRLILHFGAVDFAAKAWVNGLLAVEHEGGYTPFSADITELLNAEGEQSLVVRAQDDPLDMNKPRGKQDWLPEPHSIWYYRTTGIWQTVWMEVTPQTRIAALRWSPDVPHWEIGVEAKISGPLPHGMRLRVELSARGTPLCDDTYGITSSHIHRKIVLPDPGIGDGREFLFWWPHRPTLIKANLSLVDAEGNVVDAVSSYTAMRTVSLLGNRFILNGHPYPLQMVLNQGYWPQGGLTAPNDNAFRRDVELIKEMGFNGARMHQKIESPRFLFWADTLGLLVWEEMPSAYAFSSLAIERMTREWTVAIDRDISHPCIVAWVPFNESWGVPDLPDIAEQRHLVNAMYHLTRAMDASRPVISNDGWENLLTDIIAIHDYDRDPNRIALRYALNQENLAHLFEYERPGGKKIVLGEIDLENKPIMLTEFGGIAYSKDKNGTWGYSRAQTSDELARLYFELLAAVRSIPMFSGFCYTQFTDTYQEANGLLFMDRSPKFPLARMAVATRGAREPSEQKLEQQWRKKTRQLESDAAG